MKLQDPKGTETRGLLERTALGDVWGVGRRLVERPTLQSIETARDLRQADPKAIRRRYSVTLERTLRELQGTPCIELNDVRNRAWPPSTGAGTDS